MSKYRVEFKQSRLLLVLQLLTYAVLVLSVFYWQLDIIQYQISLQTLLISIITYCTYKSISQSRIQRQNTVVFSQLGDWLEITVDSQIGWVMTSKSRISSFMLFIHMVSAVNRRHSKWCLIYKDQVSEKDFRRLCRAVIYQQQKNTGKD